MKPHVESFPEVLVPDSQEIIGASQTVSTPGDTNDDPIDNDTVPDIESDANDDEDNSALLEGFDFDDNLADPNDATDSSTKSSSQKEQPEDDFINDGIDWAALFEDDQDSISSSQAKPLKFFWLDAYEDPFKTPEYLFLFGKVFCEVSGKLKSCCLRVTGLERILFLLPRQSRKSDPNVQVTTKDLYLEFDKLAQKMKVSFF